jgi:hypothetical protein
MPNILQFVRPTSAFDPDTLMLLGSAFDRARSSLENMTHSDAVHEMMAGRIFDAAMRGERDPDKLCRIALRGFYAPIQERMFDTDT